MLRFLIFIKHHCKFLWNLAEYGNGILVGWFYGRRIVSVVSRVLTETSSVNQEYRLLRLEDVSEVCTFFLRQPENSYLYFNPHAFDEKTIRRLLKNPSFLMMGVFDGNKLIGYFFLRFFMNRLLPAKWGVLCSELRGQIISGLLLPLAAIIAGLWLLIGQLMILRL